MNPKHLSAIVISLFLLAHGPLFSQEKQIKKADDAFNVGEYFAATEKYEKIYEGLTDKKDKAYVSFKLGECARITNDAKKAKKWYKAAVKNEYTDPLSVLYYAQALMMTDESVEAAGQFERYTQLMPDDVRGHNGVKSCKLITELRGKPSRHTVTEATTVNSKFTDFAPAFGKSTSELYFTSTREGSNGTTPSRITGLSFSDIYVAVKDNKEKWSVPVPVAGLVNTPGSEGAPCIISNGSTMYYTYCKQAEGENHGCKIFKTRKSGDAWGQPEYVPIVKDSSITVAHPAVSADEMTLYFVSDMPGGKGGKDIWVTERASASGTWGKPENLGAEINTSGDEMYPFIRRNGELYFSSNVHPGCGGLDIFKAEKKDGKWNVSNMGVPINSPSDDFGITFFEDTEEGYFSSARNKEDNLFHFIIPPLVFTLKGLVTNSETDEPLTGATVKMVASNGAESEVSSATDGSFVFRLTEDLDYTITASRSKFLASYRNISTRGIRESQEFQTKLDLGPIKGKMELPNIQYDLGKAELRPESFASLDKLVEILTVNPNITIALIANTDIRGSDDANMKLSQARAQSVVDYLLKKGIVAERLTPSGLGETAPRKIDGTTAAGRELIKQYPFLKHGDVLNEAYINALTDKAQKEICHQLNRRTEFEVLRDDYGLGDLKGFGSE